MMKSYLSILRFVRVQNHTGLIVANSPAIESLGRCQNRCNFSWSIEKKFAHSHTKSQTNPETHGFNNEKREKLYAYQIQTQTQNGKFTVVDSESSEENLNNDLTINELKRDFIDSLAPPLGRSFNLAAYVNHSDTLKALLALRVSLYDIENVSLDNAKYLLGLDFQRDCLKHIQFLVDNGLRGENLGRFISENPRIFSETLEDLQIRLNYLRSKGFTQKMIAKILNSCPLFLTMKTKNIDHKLGLLQVEFGFNDNQLRTLVVKDPYCILQPHGKYIVLKFSLLEEFGFTKRESQRLLIGEPSILERDRDILHKIFSTLHHEIGLSHEMMVRFPKLFATSTGRAEMSWRYQFLKRLNRHQFDPSKPLYVPPSALYEPNDEEFCEKYAKTSIENYRAFLKTI